MTERSKLPLDQRGLLRVSEAAEWAGIGRSEAYRLINCGEWEYVPLGTKKRIRLEWLREWARKNAKSAASQ